MKTRSQAVRNPSGRSQSPERPMNRRRLIEWAQLLLSGKNILRNGIDLGTSSSSFCYAYAPKKNTDLSHAHTMFRVEDSEGFRIPTLAAIRERQGDDGNVYPEMIFGQEVQEGIKDRRFDMDSVFTLMKLGIVDRKREKISGDESKLYRVKSSHQRLFSRIQNTLVYVLDALNPDNSQYHRVDSIEKVITLFLQYLFNKAKLHLQNEAGFERRDVEIIFRNAIFAVSVPTVWSDLLIDKFEGILTDAGFPKRNIHILSEAKSAAVYQNICEAMELLGPNVVLRTSSSNLSESQVSMIVDIGCGTTDVSTLRRFTTSSVIKMSEVILGSGALCGSEKLNEKFFQKLHMRRRQELQQLAQRLQLELKHVLQGFTDGFEDKKRSFGNRESDYTIWCKGFAPMTSILVDRNFIREIFDEWLEEVADLIEEQNSRLKALGTTPDTINLAGWGSQPPYVIDWMRMRYQNKHETITVRLIERKGHPSVAWGNVWSLLDMELCQQRFARMWYGIRQNVEFDPRNALHQQLRTAGQVTYSPCFTRGELVDRACWKIPRGIDLLRTSTANEFQGFITIDKGDVKYPLKDVGLELIATSDPEMADRDEYWEAGKWIAEGRIQAIGLLSLKTITPQTSHFELRDNLDGSGTGLNLHYVASIHQDKMVSRWKIEVPFTGQISPVDSSWRDDPRTLRSECRVKTMVEHAARYGDVEKRIR